MLQPHVQAALPPRDPLPAGKTAANAWYYAYMPSSCDCDERMLWWLRFTITSGPLRLSSFICCPRGGHRHTQPPPYCHTSRFASLHTNGDMSNFAERLHCRSGVDPPSTLIDTLFWMQRQDAANCRHAATDIYLADQTIQTACAYAISRLWIRKVIPLPWGEPTAPRRRTADSRCM